MPDRLSLPTMRQAAQECRGCDLHQGATQAVFGEGRRTAILMMVGEQPGDQEDRQGRPFVGPAGRILDEALEQSGISRAEVYLTNAVKHFKNIPRGGRRIHGKPTAGEVRACRPWLEAELQVVRPRMLVALGATAAQDLFGSAFRVTQRRGQPFESDLAAWCMATLHPSALLRMPDEQSRAAAWKDFLGDFRTMARQHRLEAAQAASAR